MRWNIYNKNAVKMLNKKEHIIVKYEDLVSQTEIELKRIFNFLKIENKIYPRIKSTAILDPKLYGIAPKYHERFYKKYGDLNKDVYPERKFSWKDALEKKEIACCESFCGKTGELFGYQKTQYSLNYFFYLKLVYLKSLISAVINFSKDRIIYFISPQIKLNRLKKKYIEIGFIEK